MKDSYNYQEEINEITARVNEITSTLTVRMDELEESLRQIGRIVKDLANKVDNAERKQRRSDIKVEDIEGTLAQKLRTLGEMTKWKKP